MEPDMLMALLGAFGGGGGSGGAQAGGAMGANIGGAMGAADGAKEKVANMNPITSILDGAAKLPRPARAPVFNPNGAPAPSTGGDDLRALAQQMLQSRQGGNQKG